MAVKQDQELKNVMKYYPELKKIKSCASCEDRNICRFVIRYSTKEGCFFYKERKIIFKEKNYEFNQQFSNRR